MLCLGLLMLPMVSPAQARWEGGFAIGGAGYQGELAPNWYPDLLEPGANYGFLIRRHLSRQLALRLNFGYAEIYGDDNNLAGKDFETRNFRFRSQLGNAALSLEWEPLGRRRYPNRYQFKALAFSPYIYSGAGILYTDASPDFTATRTDQFSQAIRKDESENAPGAHFCIPFGLGLKLDLSQRALFGFELGTLTAFTDYLDGISHSGNPGSNDWMPYAQLTFTLRLTPKDSDRDGIADKEDSCPLVKGNWTAMGCPDEDGDGVEDLEDVCPLAAGPRQLNGCPDTDGDGVADREDRCPNLKGVLATMGCPDYDNDELADHEDECPFLPGPKGRLGCPVLDTDGDGDLSDEAEICLMSPVELDLQLTEKHTQEMSALVKALRPPARIQSLVEEDSGPKEKTAIAIRAGIF